MQARCRATRGERNAGYACIRWPHMPEAAVLAMGICRFGMQRGAEGPRRVLRDFRSIQRFLPVLDSWTGTSWMELLRPSQTEVAGSSRIR